MSLFSCLRGVLALSVLLFPACAQAASFDCGKAASHAERLICSSPRLSELDTRLAQAYQAALARDPHPGNVRASQRSWLRQVRDQCQSAPCLTQAYQQRIAALPPAALAAPLAPLAPSDPVSQCDALASHPDDPEALAAGVSDDQLAEAQAMPACSAAVALDPGAPRLKFQLGRSYLKAGRIDSAAGQLTAAAQAGHGAALAYLADLAMDGAGGMEADPLLAHQLYEKAAANGFKPALRILAEFEDKTDDVASEPAQAGAAAGGGAALTPYRNPEVIEKIASRQFDQLSYNERWVKQYLVNIADNIRAVCESGFTQNDVDRLKALADADPLNLGAASLASTFLGLGAILKQLTANPGLAMQQNAGVQDTDDIFVESMQDTEALFQRHGCNTPGLDRFGKNLRAYVQNDDAPIPSPNAFMAACMKDPLPSKYPPDQFCMCFGGVLKMVGTSQAKRKDLLKNFRSAASDIMNKPANKGRFSACQQGFQ